MRVPVLALRDVAARIGSAVGAAGMAHVPWDGGAAIGQLGVADARVPGAAAMARAMPAILVTPDPSPKWALAALRTGARDAVLLSELPAALRREAIRLGRGATGLFVTVFPPCGGAGVTLLATELARTAARLSGRPVGFLDLAPRPAARVLLGVRQVAGAQRIVGNGVSCLVPDGQDGAEAAMDEASGRFALTLVDGGSTLEGAVAAMDRSNTVLVVAPLEVAALERVARLPELFERLRYIRRKLWYVARRVPSGIGPESLRRMGVPARAVVPHVAEGMLAKAAFLGCSVAEVRPRSAFARVVGDLAWDLLAECRVPVAEFVRTAVPAVASAFREGRSRWT